MERSALTDMSRNHDEGRLAGWTMAMNQGKGRGWGEQEDREV